MAEWKGRGADALVVGSVARLADGRFDVRYRLLDTVKQAQLDGLSYVSTAADMRLTAHRIADRIYEKITGERGVFATRIAYVVQTSPKSWELHIADADGFNPQAALRSREPIISPAWSPDGTRLAYVSFESGKPVVYVHSVTTGERRAVANFRGSNSAPAWSPDGRSLAVTLTREGNSQIFLMNADGSNVRRLTTSSGIDTEPAFSVDGGSIYFTSDRGGGPQIYRMPVGGGAAQRVTFNGDYNISARVSPDGKQLAYIGRRGGRLQVYVLDIATGQEVLATDTTSDESPSFAPERPIAALRDCSQRPGHSRLGIDRRARTYAAVGPERRYSRADLGSFYQVKCINGIGANHDIYPSFTQRAGSRCLRLCAGWLFIGQPRRATACTDCRCDRRRRATKTGPDPRAVAPVDAQAGRGLDPLNDPNNPLSKRSVFFDFDSFVVKSEYQPIVQTHGSYLGTNKQRRVTVEGHTDERGGREYNLALGAEARRSRQTALDVVGRGRLAGRDRQLRRRKAARIGVQRRRVGAESAGGFELSVAVQKVGLRAAGRPTLVQRQ